MTTGLTRIAEKAKADRKARFTSLAHLLTPEFLLETWRQMNRRAAGGVDGETMQEFERDGMKPLAPCRLIPSCLSRRRRRLRRSVAPAPRR